MYSYILNSIPLTLPHVISGAFECWSEALRCCRQSVRDGEVSLHPVFVLHHWSQILVHVVHSQHWHLREKERDLTSHSRFLVAIIRGNVWRGKPESFCQSAGSFQSHHHLRQMDWWSALPPTKQKQKLDKQTVGKKTACVSASACLSPCSCDIQ